MTHNRRPILVALIILVLCWLYAADTALDPGNGDPYVYLHAAQTLREGQGLRNPAFDQTITQAITGEAGALMATWPPLYPMVLAALGGGLPAARIMNAVGLWLCLVLMASLYRAYGMGWPLVVACAGAFVVWISDSHHTFRSAASETLFIPLVLVWLWLLPRVHQDGVLFALSGVSGALVMTRYIGLVFVILGGLYVVVRARGGVSAVPHDPAGHLVDAELVHPGPPDRTSDERGVRAVAHHILHHGRAAGLWTIGGPSVAAARVSGVDLACIAITYLGALLAGGTATLINLPNARLMSPLVPVLVLLLWQGATALLNPL